MISCAYLSIVPMVFPTPPAAPVVPSSVPPAARSRIRLERVELWRICRGHRFPLVIGDILTVKCPFSMVKALLNCMRLTVKPPWFTILENPIPIFHHFFPFSKTISCLQPGEFFGIPGIPPTQPWTPASGPMLKLHGINVVRSSLPRVFGYRGS